MTGALIQLAVKGKEDAYFSVPPEFGLWRVAFRKIANFAIEPLPLQFRKDPRLGGTSHCIVERLGDMLCNLIVEMTLTKQAGDFTAAYHPAEAVLEEITLVIDGTVVDRCTSDWLHIFNKMHKAYDKAQQHIRMTNFDPEVISSGEPAAQTFMFPLPFSFCRHAGSALPLVAMQFSEIAVHFKFADAAACGLSPDGFDIRVFGHYVFVDQEERMRIAKNPHDYLIEQVHTQTFTLPDDVPNESAVSTFQAKLNFYHPVKCLYWFMKSEFGATHGRYFGDPTGVPLAYTPDVASPSGLCLVSPLSDNLNPIYESKLMFNEQDRTASMRSQYFNRVLPYLHCTGQPVQGVSIMPFGFQLEQFNPVGLCNFSTLAHAALEVKIKRNAGTGEPPAATAARDIGALTKLVVIAWGYNILRVEAGRGVVAFR